MKTEGAIRYKIKQARYRHLKRLIEQGLAQSPENCAHNRMFHSPATAAAGQPPVGVCVCPGQNGDLLCDAAWGGVDRARSCPLFQASTTKEQIKAEFTEFLSTSELPIIAREYPDLAALMWVVDDAEPVGDVDVPPEPEVPTTVTAPPEPEVLTPGAPSTESESLVAISREPGQREPVPDSPAPTAVPMKASWWKAFFGRWL